MAKKRNKITVTTLNYGLYAKWSNRCRELPKFLKFTTKIPARIEAEFGYTLEIKGAKGKSICYEVHHPPFCDNEGTVEATFTGEIAIHSNTFYTYLGDTLWEPIDDKVGIWRVVARIDNQVIEDKSFSIVADISLFSDLIEEHKNIHLDTL